MKTINRKELLSIIQQDSNINFIAYLITPWHAISLNAALLYYKSKGINLRGVALIYPHVASGLHLAENDFEDPNIDVYISSDWGGVYNSCYDQDKSRLFNKWQKIKQSCRFYHHVLFGQWNVYNRPNFFVFAPVFPMIGVGLDLQKMDKQIKYVALDEGIGTYLDNMEETLPRVRSIRDFKCIKNYWRDTIVTNHILPVFHKMQNAYLFYKKNNICYVNQEMILFYRQAVAAHMTRCQLYIDLTNTIVICTSVLCDHIFRDKEDVRVWGEICEQLHHSGFKLAMKPHPRDTFFASFVDSWNCKLLDAKLSMEEICEQTRPMAIIGHHSTALVTASALWNIPTICVTELFDRTKVDFDFMRIADKYKETFGGMIRFPKDMDGLIESIN